jgi:hypothetical protein
MGSGQMAQRDLKRVRAARRRLESAEEALREAVLAASRSGESLRDIAPYAGLSPTRIHQILREAERE